MMVSSAKIIILEIYSEYPYTHSISFFYSDVFSTQSLKCLLFSFSFLFGQTNYDVKTWGYFLSVCYFKTGLKRTVQGLFVVIITAGKLFSFQTALKPIVTHTHTHNHWLVFIYPSFT